MSEQIKLSGVPESVDGELLTTKLEEAFKSATGLEYHITILDIHAGDFSDDITINAFPATNQD